MSFKSKLKQNYFVNRMMFFIKLELPVIAQGRIRLAQKQFKEKMGYLPDFKNPSTMNEKLRWLELYDKTPMTELVSDKILMRSYIAEMFGEEYLVPLLKKYENWKDISYVNLPNIPFVIKSSTGFKSEKIVKDRNNVDIEKLRSICREWMHFNRYYYTLEWQYKRIKPCVFAEEFLTDKYGNLPRCYSFYYYGGELQFISCETKEDNYNAFFSPQWELLPFQWVNVRKHQPIRTFVNEKRPDNFNKMIEYGDRIAGQSKYIRIDYIEVEGKMFFRDISQYSGEGMKRFFPPECENGFVNKISLV